MRILYLQDLAILEIFYVPILQVQEAYLFYRLYILEYSFNKAAVYQQYGFSVQGSISSKDWEVFAAILFNDKARRGDGADLEHHEVKSATMGGSFEYQYHRNHGLTKLLDEQNVDHIFIARSENYMGVKVWFVERNAMIPIFDKWRPKLELNYAVKDRQRFRCSVAYGFVKSKGICVLEISDGELVYFLEST